MKYWEIFEQEALIVNRSPQTIDSKQSQGLAVPPIVDVAEGIVAKEGEKKESSKVLDQVGQWMSLFLLNPVAVAPA